MSYELCVRVFHARRKAAGLCAFAPYAHDVVLFVSPFVFFVTLLNSEPRSNGETEDTLVPP